ncbi:MAG: DUF2156 domain-containing protein [Deltaproteobacteria bacterium]|nr:DUF2156 domain-containing protein [Deltaproteobacteria bacterium]
MLLEGYRDLELEHKSGVQAFLTADPPLTSELTFTNLYMWRHHYLPQWREEAGCLLVVVSPPDTAPFGLPPVGRGDHAAAVAALGRDLAAAGLTPRLARVGRDLAQSLPAEQYLVEHERDQDDYVYLAQDLRELKGRKYHRKKNHLNKFLRAHPRHEYQPLTAEICRKVLDMQEHWCRLRGCEDDPGLASEDLAICEAILAREALGLTGGVILLDGRVEAFSLGEMLNPQTAVIHVEKANPEIDGLYTAINQRFCQEAWSGAEFINREQDLGLEGLRAAKESYLPHHLEEKFRVTWR